jgi:hypothetical protein
MKTCRSLFILCVVLFSWQSVLGQNPVESLLDEPVHNLSLKGNSITWILKEVSTRCRVPIGLERALSATDSSEIKIDIKEGTIRDALDAVIQGDPRYDFRVVGGVINFSPKVQRDPFLADLLETRIKNFRIEKGTGLWDIRANISQLPEISAKLKGGDVLPVIVAFMSADFSEASPGFGMEVHDVTLRELLNNIVRTSDTKYWTIRRYGDRFHSLGLNF